MIKKNAFDIESCFTNHLKLKGSETFQVEAVTLPDSAEDEPESE